MSDITLCAFCDGEITHMHFATPCCGELFHQACYIAHRDAESAKQYHSPGTE